MRDDDMNSRAKLHELLRLCSDNSDEVSRLIIIDRMTHSSEYQKMKTAGTLRSLLNSYYPLAILEKMGLDELKQREMLMHETVSLYDRIVKSIHYGNAPELSKNDRPDYKDLSSLLNLKNKIVLSTNKKNISNIGEDEVMSIFADQTIKSAQQCFDCLPVNIAKKDSITERDVSEGMAGALYCVDKDQFDSIHWNFLRFLLNSEKIIASEQLRRKKHRLFKIATIMVCFGSVFACTQFGLISESYSFDYSVIMMLVSLVYMIVG